MWKQSETAPLQFNKAFGEDSDDEADSDRKEYWSVISQFRVMEGEDVYDLAWSPEGKHLIIGLTDNSAQIWDIQQGGRCIKALKDHQHFVQGVAWDPLDQLLVTQSSDRSVKIWTMRRRQNSTSTNLLNMTNSSNSSSSNNSISFIALTKYTKISANLDESTAAADSVPVPVAYSMFHDETLVSFFRRPTFSPDGSILVLPAGLKTPLTSSTSSNFTHSHGIYLNMRNNLHRTPTAFIGGFEKAAIAIRFNPKYYPLISGGSEGGNADNTLMPWLSLPYRMIFSVITQNAIYIFDTQRTTAIFMFSNLHYASLTDATWSCDGRSLVVSSVDGFCTVADFDQINDFGAEPFETNPAFMEEMVEMVKSSSYHNPPAKVKKTTNFILKEESNSNSNDMEIDLEDGVDVVIEEDFVGVEETVVVNSGETVTTSAATTTTTNVATSKMSNTENIDNNSINSNNINILPVKVKKRIAPTLISNSNSTN